MKNKKFILFLAVCTLFNMAASFAHPVTPTLIVERGLDSSMFGVALAAMMTMNFCFSPFWGKINTYISSRQTLLICCAGYGVAQLGFACATTQGMILLVRILAGVFVGGINVSFLTYVINMAKPEDQAKFLTYSATIQAVCGAFGYLVGGILGGFVSAPGIAGHQRKALPSRFHTHLLCKGSVDLCQFTAAHQCDHGCLQ